MTDLLSQTLSQVDEDIAKASQERTKRTQAAGPAPQKPATGSSASAPQGGAPRKSAAAPPSGKRDTGGISGALTRIITGASEGAINTLGAPVDFVNWGLGKLTGGALHSDAPVGGSESIRSVFSKATGYKSQEEVNRATGGSSGHIEDIATKTANFLGGSVVPVAGLYGSGAKLIRAGGPGALSTTSAAKRVLQTMALETAKHPGVAVASEAGAALGAATAGEAVETYAPDSPYLEAGAEILGGIAGGFGGAASTLRRASAVGADSTGKRILGWSDEAGKEVPIYAEDAGKSVNSSEADLVTPPKDAPDAALELKAFDPADPAQEIPVGTIGKKELEDLQAEVEAFRARVDAGDTRAPDITWEKARVDAEKVGEFRLGNLGNADDTANLLGALSRQLPSKGVRSDAELMVSAREAAKDIGEDPEAMLALGRQVAGKLGDADSAMATLRTVWSRASSEINQLYLAKVNWQEADADLVAHAGEAIRNLSQLSQMVQQAKVGLGRGLRVLQLPDAETYIQDLQKAAKGAVDDVEPVPPREMPPLPRTREEMKDWFDLWSLTDGDPTKQSAFLQGLLTVPTPGKYMRQSVANFFTASILSAPRTVLLNVIGPSSISVIRNAERFTGAAVQSLNPLLSAEERAAMRATARFTAKAYVQTFGDIQNTFKMALRSADVNHTIIGGHGQTLDAQTTFGPFTENMLRAAGTQPSVGYTLGNAINFWPKAFARLNNGLDEFAKRMAYQGEVRINAMVAGAQRGLKGDALQAYVDDALKSSYDEVGRATDANLLRSAERTTLTSTVGAPDSNIRKFSSWLQQLRSDIPETRFIVPVFNVPANALGETLRRLPIARIPGLNRLMFEEAAAELAGERGPVAQAEAHGRFLLGASFLTAGFMLNKQGLLTGAGPQDPTDRKVWLQTHQPYSIKVGGDWVRYDKFDIAGALLSIPATISDSTTYNPDDKQVEDAVWAGVGALAQWFKDRAALRNATDILNAGSDPTKDTGNLAARFAGNIAGGFFPAALRTTLTDTTAQAQAMKRSWFDYVKSTIPGAANTLEPVRNVLGEPVMKANNTLGEAIVPVSLVKAIGYDEDPVLDELDRLYEHTGYGAGADSRALGYGFFAPQDVELEDGKSMYYHFMQGRQVQEVDGQTLRQALTELFNSQEYNEAVDGDSQSKMTSRGDGSRGYMVREVFTKFNEAIKADMAAASPKARAYLTAAAAKRKDDAYLRDVSVEDLVQNPRLYDIKGVYRQGFEDSLLEGSTGALVEALQ